MPRRQVSNGLHRITSNGEENNAYTTILNDLEVGKDEKSKDMH